MAFLLENPMKRDHLEG